MICIGVTWDQISHWVWRLHFLDLYKLGGHHCILRMNLLQTHLSFQTCLIRWDVSSFRLNSTICVDHHWKDHLRNKRRLNMQWEKQGTFAVDSNTERWQEDWVRGLESWLSSEEHLLLPSICGQVRQFTTTCNFISRGSNTLFWPSGTWTHINIHSYKHTSHGSEK